MGGRNAREHVRAMTATADVDRRWRARLDEAIDAELPAELEAALTNVRAHGLGEGYGAHRAFAHEPFEPVPPSTNRRGGSWSGTRGRWRARGGMRDHRAYERAAARRHHDLEARVAFFVTLPARRGGREEQKAKRRWDVEQLQRRERQEWLRLDPP